MTVSQAVLSGALATLFPPGIACAELAGAGDPDSLLPTEALHVAGAVDSRREQFAAGRACARLALREFGVLNFSLQVAEDRRPLWPAGMAGSITHTRGFAAAVVAQRICLPALGIDTEKAGSVKPELWPRICGPETAWLRALPQSQRPAAATLIFSAKEAFYKCQYALTAEYLGFDDVRVEILTLGDHGEFWVHACKALLLAQHVPLPLAGRYLFHQAFVTAGIAIAQ